MFECTLVLAGHFLMTCLADMQQQEHNLQFSNCIGGQVMSKFRKALAIQFPI